MSVWDDFKLDGKVALVTGASSGLGWACAEAVAEAGADVACVGRNETRVNRAAGMVRSLGRRAVAIRADVSNEDNVKQMVERTVTELGHLDIVFANAGIAPEYYSPLEGDLETWQHVINVNLTGVYLTIRESAKIMAPQGRGKIISTSSIVGIVGYFEGTWPAYNAAKSGVDNLTKTYAIALAPNNIQVNAIAPGFFRTAIGKGEYIQEEPDEETREWFNGQLKRIPLNRFGEPKEIKGLALFLASSASDYVTGSTMVIDGGWLAW